MEEGYEKTIWGMNGNTATKDYDYSSSSIAQKASTFQDSLPQAALESAFTTTIDGKSSKIFVPTNYYLGNINLTCLVDGEAVDWWLSSTVYEGGAYYVRYVDKSGNIAYKNGWMNDAPQTYFRPAVVVKQPEPKTTVYINGNEISL